MAVMVRCEQCGKLATEQAAHDARWVLTLAWREYGQPDDKHKVFCSWECCGIYATARSLVGESR